MSIVCCLFSRIAGCPWGTRSEGKEERGEEQQAWWSFEPLAFAFPVMMQKLGGGISSESRDHTGLPIQSALIIETHLAFCRASIWTSFRVPPTVWSSTSGSSSELADWNERGCP